MSIAWREITNQNREIEVTLDKEPVPKSLEEKPYSNGIATQSIHFLLSKCYRSHTTLLGSWTIQLCCRDSAKTYEQQKTTAWCEDYTSEGRDSLRAEMLTVWSKWDVDSETSCSGGKQRGRAICGVGSGARKSE